MNVDIALRYVPLARLIKSEYPNLKTPILEVGSGVNGISDFYKGEVWGVDSDFSKTKTAKNKNIKHFKGTILKVPFPKERFEVVVCFDTFEHIEEKVRVKALEELIRVTKKNGTVYLGFPSGNLSGFMERIINFVYKLNHGKYHPWLLEHSQLGLPDTEKISKYLDRNKIEYRKIYNFNLLAWVIVHFFFTSNEGNKIGKFGDKFSKLIYLFAKVMNFPPFYRTIFVIKK